MKPYFSIIIPYHNSAGTIGRLLASIQRSPKAPAYEVIVVDDGSQEKYNGYNGYKNYKSYIRILRLNKNHGPAVARNRGVAAARGKIVVFVDSDVELFPDALANLAKIYQDDPDIVAVTGVWVKEQRTNAFFPNYKAMRDWSYWINERDKSGYYFLFSTRIASIKKSVFQRLGGFDETYPSPLVEDIELTYRIARRYAIIFAPNVRVRHEFEPFWPVAKKYFLRAYYWTKLYARRKKFDPVATTWWEALTTISGVGVVLFFPFSLIGQIGQIGLICFLLFHLFLTRKFLLFMVREKGIVFAIKGFFTGLILYCFIFTGAVAGRLKYNSY
ncbi:glycosyltransferase family 2 protein [Candidatus Gottesmanbacteria bacterium]|nr:glycosyltransferase family 2 protein [Candidatus Gottesmanbacteria bacterium]